MTLHALHWFEIPAHDLARAYTFYHAVLNGHVRMGTFGGPPLGLFDVPFQDGSAVGGSIVQRDDMVPSTSGVLVYLNIFGSLADAVSRVEGAGGTIVAPHIPLGGFGSAAIIRDTEGDQIGLLEPPTSKV